MNRSNLHRRKHRVLARHRNQRGIALATSLLLVVLLSAMSLTMVLSVGSDMLVNGYYGNERGSFYAADSGAAIARQAIISGILGQVPANFSASTSPIPASAGDQTLSNVKSAYANFTTINGPSGSWPEKFEIVGGQTTLLAPSCTVQGGPALVNGNPIGCGNLPGPNTNPSTNDPNTPAVTGFKYIYPYTITAVGQAQGTEATTLVDSGNLVFNASVKPSGNQTKSFASYGTFIDKYPPCSAPFVAGTLTGPFFTNGAWNFGDANALGSSTKYDFKNDTGQANGNVSFWHGGNCDEAAAASDTANGTTIAPKFEAQFNIGAPTVQLPQDDYNQLKAVLDGIGAANGVAPNLGSSNLKNAAGTASGSNPSSGVYVPYTVDNSGVKTFKGGGIYVAGDANVTLSPSGTSGQVYTIVQSGVTTTVTIQPTGLGTGTTTIQTGGTVNTIQGVPTMIDPNTMAPTENATMLYVNGNINSLSGPGEYTTAINNGQAVTVTASGNVCVTGDIRYATEPVTTSANQTVAGTTYPSPDTLINNPANNTGQVLGIFTAKGDIQMNNSQHDGNLEIDASIAMISNGGNGGWINVGPQINTLNLVGGRIANVAKSGNTITRNIFFDQRFAQGNFAPPWYPSTIVTQSTTDTASFKTNVDRLQWNYKSAYQ